MVSTIPLFQLPKRAIKFTLKHCGITQLILFSTLSKRAKGHVRSDERYAYYITVDISTGCSVSLHTHDTIIFGKSQQRDTDIQSITPCTVLVEKRYGSAEIGFALPGFKVRDWLLHFTFIFNNPKINVSFGDRDEWMYSVDSIREVLEGFPIEELRVSKNACEIIKKFPNMNCLQLDRNRTEPQLSEADSNFIKKVIIGNMASLIIYRAISFDLNTLLTMKCPYILITRNSLTDKELNMFLKLWLKGAGPSLQEVDIYFLRVRVHLDHSAILRGIEYQRTDGNYVPEYTIWKRDGTRATLLMSINRFIFSVLP